jgi:hypothetical protein
VFSTTTRDLTPRWEALPHPAYSPDLAPSDFHLFGPLIEALGGKRFTADDEVELFVQRWLGDNHELFFLKGAK